MYGPRGRCVAKACDVIGVEVRIHSGGTSVSHDQPWIHCLQIAAWETVITHSPCAGTCCMSVDSVGGRDSSS